MHSLPKKVVVTALSLSVSIAVSNIAAAQSSEENLALNPVVVTASRTAINKSLVGSSITVIDRQQIEQRQATYVLDLLRDVPGLAVSRTGVAGSQAQVRVRGAEANQVLVLIDGVEANDPSNGDDFSYAHLLTTDIERIEVVRGPQSALWGSDALSGVINIITRKGDRNEFTAHAEGGSFDTFRYGFNGGWRSDDAYFRLAAEQLDTDGENIARNGTEDDGYKNTTVSISGGSQLTEQLKLDISGRHIKGRNDFDGVDFAVTGLPVDADKVTKSRQTYINASLEWVLANWSHRFSARYSDFENENFSDGANDTVNAGDKTGFYYQAHLDFGNDQAQQGLTLAVDHEETNFTQRGTASPFGDPNQDQTLDTTGYIAEYNGLFSDHWSVNASLRRDDNSDFSDKTTYRLSTAYLLAEQRGRVWAAIGTGHKAPTFTERFGFFADVFVGNPNLKPEESESWEIGYERNLFAGQGLLSVVYFDEQLNNEINGFFFDANAGGFTAVNQDGKSNRKGVETSFDWNINSEWTLNANYTYTDSDQPNPAGGQIREIRRPEHMAYVGLNYNRQRLNINTSLSYNGEQIDNFFPPYPEPTQRVELSDYVLANVAVNYQLSEDFNLNLRGENLLDEDYEDVFGFNTMGRAFFIGLKWTQ